MGLIGRKGTPSIKSTHSTNSVRSAEDTAPAVDDGNVTTDAGDLPELETPADGELPSESGRLKQLLGLLKRSMGVKDLAAVRLSLPATVRLAGLAPALTLQMLHPMGYVRPARIVG